MTNDHNTDIGTSDPPITSEGISERTNGSSRECNTSEPAEPCSLSKHDDGSGAGSRSRSSHDGINEIQCAQQGNTSGEESAPSSGILMNCLTNSTGSLPPTDSGSVLLELPASSDPQITQALRFREMPELRVFFSDLRFGKALVFDNHVSEARDLSVCEVNFLSWISLSLYLLVAAAVLCIDVRIPVTGHEPAPDPGDTDHTLDVVLRALWAIFLAGSFAVLLAGMANYIHQVSSYAAMRSRVTSLKVLNVVMIILSLIILATNILLLVEI